MEGILKHVLSKIIYAVYAEAVAYMCGIGNIRLVFFH